MATSFAWPDGRRCALSFSFDDARPSQIARGVPLFDRFGVRASFFVLMRAVRTAPDLWRAALRSGHEFGNHTSSHPCSGNFSFVRDHALEDLTLDAIERDILEANAQLTEFIGSAPTSFAYCCGHKFVGRGIGTRSYVPLVARHFLVGRGFRDEYPNDPTFVDLAQVAGVDADGASSSDLIRLIDQAAAAGSWLVLVGHEVADAGAQTVIAAELERLLVHLRSRPEVWVDTVGAIGGHVASVRAR
ncbi:MAG: polysaccharide deacetylase family protein [Planctomycetes bacterium]|nr:polysaccharide deacetylase family protein [Planctomycetota bacterium]